MSKAASREPGMLVLGNAKLGRRLIWSFSLPAVKTCPGSSPSCRAACYALKGHYNHHAVQAKYVRNLERSKQPEFVGDILAELRKTGASVVRIHGSGDFHSAAYAKKWLAILRKRRTATFYFYTRSWRAPKVRETLREMAVEPNCHAWYSWDATMPVPERDPGVRLAYMLGADEGEDSPNAPLADLVFRVRHHDPAKWIGGTLVCPYEQGMARKEPITCERCRICFSARVDRRRG